MVAYHVKYTTYDTALTVRNIILKFSWIYTMLHLLEIRKDMNNNGELEMNNKGWYGMIKCLLPIES